MTPALGKGLQALLPGMASAKTMTVKEVAEALGVHPDTVHSWIDKVFPGIKSDGKQTRLDEYQVTEIKKAMNQNYSLRNAPKVTTDLEMMQQGAAFYQWAMSKLAQAETQLALMAPKAEAFDTFHRSDAEMSITDAAKHFGYKQGETFKALDAGGYLTSKRMPTSKALDDNILTIREVCIGQKADGTPKYTRQAVVHAGQLMNFKAVLDKRVKK